jgi:hypothetical protein
MAKNPLDGMDGIKVEKGFYTEEDAKREKGAIMMDSSMDKEQIHDLEKLTTELLKFLEYISTEEMQKLEESDHEAFVTHLEAKFEEFSLIYHSIFKMLTDKEEKNNRDSNIMKLLSIFEKLASIQRGERDMAEEFEKFQENLAEEHVYPKFGGKENFVKEIKKRARRKQKKDNKH